MVNEMKKLLLTMAVAALGVLNAGAQKFADVTISDFKAVKSGDKVNVSMKIDLSQIDVKNQMSVHYVPELKNGADSLELPPVGVYSRNRYIAYLRRGESVFESLGEAVYKNGEQEAVLDYDATVDYQKWMDGAEVVVRRKTFGCCQDMLGEEAASDGSWTLPVFTPHLIFVTPQPDLHKYRELSGTAFIDYVVSCTDIDPTYRNNKAQLDKVIATIDSVRLDKDVTIKHIYLKGFASPESPYDNNARLAKGRTESLKQYILGLIDVAEEQISTSYVPENWEGLREFLVASDVNRKESIIKVIDRDYEPDHKEWLIKSIWPEQYEYLLQNCYPALRKTDYVIEYAISSYTDIEKLIEVYYEFPERLSLEEFYVVAAAMGPDSKEYVAVFRDAVEKYPEDPVANLNIANVEIAKGDYAAAKKYLERAGEMPESTYARALYYMATGSYDRAEYLFKKAQKNGIEESAQMLEQCNRLRSFNTNN